MNGSKCNVFETKQLGTNQSIGNKLFRIFKSQRKTENVLITNKSRMFRRSLLCSLVKTACGHVLGNTAFVELLSNNYRVILT